MQCSRRKVCVAVYRHGNYAAIFQHDMVGATNTADCPSVLLKKLYAVFAAHSLMIHLVCCVVKRLPKFLNRLLYEVQELLNLWQVLRNGVYGFVAVLNRAAGKVFD